MTLRNAIQSELSREAQRLTTQAYSQLSRSGFRPGGVILSSANVEHMAAQLRATAITIQRRREVTEAEPGIFAVSNSAFSTTDPVLAASVAAELDRVDPLP